MHKENIKQVSIQWSIIHTKEMIMLFAGKYMESSQKPNQTEKNKY